MGFIIFLVIAVGIVAWAIGVYNNIVKLNIRGDNAWSDVDVQLKRRYDLIPNLVETVKGYAKHENQTLESVINARSKAMSATGVADKSGAENMLTGALKSLFALSESYPDLKANQGFLSLQKDLTEIEDTIQSARRYFNAVVRDYNTMLQVFPNNIVANVFNFKNKDFFELDSPETERETPQVKF